MFSLAGDFASIVREVYDTTGSLRAAARELGIAIGTVQDFLVNPDRPRRMGTQAQITEAYFSLRPIPEPGGLGVTRYKSELWLPSHVRDIIPPRGATGWLVRWYAHEGSDGEPGWQSTQFNDFGDLDMEGFLEGIDFYGDDRGEILFSTKTRE